MDAAGRLALSYRGKSIDKLTPGRYTIKVTDRSSTNGLYLKKGKGAPVAVTNGTFVGKRSTSIRLTSGNWLVMTPAAGRRTRSS